MPEKCHTLMQQLHMAAKTNQLEKVAHGVYRLLQLVSFVPKELGEKLLATEQLRAKQFWQRVMKVRDLSDTKIRKNAVSFHTDIWAAAHDIPSPVAHALAQEHCGVVAEACEYDLNTHNAEVVEIAAKKPRFEPRVVQGGRA